MTQPAESPLPEPADPWIGQVLSSYTLIKQIGAGGMGIIYLGRHQSLGRLAAIKFLASDLVTDDGYIELFLREAKAAANLNHPNITTVYDAGKAGDDVYYFIMEYIEGRDLHTILKEHGMLPTKEAVEYIRQAANALAYAHHKHIIHRDVKPENLMLTSEGIIKVGDLGLVKWAGDPDGYMTQHGMVFGSPYYISPERLRDAKDADPRSDIYSLGASFFHMVTGRLPYDGPSTPVIMASHLNDPVPDPLQANPSLDPGLASIIQKMMAKDLKSRFQSMEQVEEALIDYQLKRFGESPAVRRDTRSIAEKQGTEPRVSRQDRLSNLTTRLVEHRPGSRKWVLVAAALLAVGLILGFPLLSRKPASNAPSQSPAKPAPKPILPPSPSVQQPPPPAPAKSDDIALPETLSDFNSGATISAWSSFPPDPRASCSTMIRPSGGADGSSVWLISYDVSVPGSFCGATLELGGKELRGNNTVKLKILGHPKTATATISMRTLKGGNEGASQLKVTATPGSWRTVEIPITSSLPIQEIAIAINHETTETKTGMILIDDITLIRK